MNELAEEADKLGQARTNYEKENDGAKIAKERAESIAEARGQVEHLEAIKLKAKVDSLAVTESAINDEEAEVVQNLADAQRSLEEVQEVLDEREQSGVGPKGVEQAERTLEQLLTKIRRVVGDRVKLSDLKLEVEELSDDVARCTTVATKAQSTLEKARENVDAVRQAHAAASLAEHLEPGDQCPVCHQEIPELFKQPKEDQGALEHANKRLKEAETSFKKAVKAKTDAEKAMAGQESKVEAHEKTLSQAERDLNESTSAVPEKLKLSSMDEVGIEQARAQLESLRAETESEVTRREELGDEITELEKQRQQLQKRRTDELRVPMRRCLQRPEAAR